MTRHDVRILGQGCGNCIWTERLVRSVIAKLGLDAEVMKVTDADEIARSGVRSSPAVVIDGRLVHAGGIPTRAQVEEWLSGLDAP